MKAVASFIFYFLCSIVLLIGLTIVILVGLEIVRNLIEDLTGIDVRKTLSRRKK